MDKGKDEKMIGISTILIGAGLLLNSVGDIMRQGESHLSKEDVQKVEQMLNSDVFKQIMASDSVKQEKLGKTADFQEMSKKYNKEIER